MAVQIHVSGFDSEVAGRDDEGIEQFIALAGLNEYEGWCGPGTTIVKRGQDGLKCYAFMSFYHAEAAEQAIEMLNAHESHLCAEFAKERGRPSINKTGDSDLPDLQFRRKRLPSNKKHPDGLMRSCTQDANYKK